MRFLGVKPRYCPYLLNNISTMKPLAMFVALNNGLKMPILGLGTFLAPKNDCENAVYNAIKIGYRLIDTASGYKNQKYIGAAIKRAIGEGIVKREDLFITTKLWVTDWRPEDMERAIKTCLDDLQLDYLDLYLIHNAVFLNLAPEDEERRRKGYFFDYETIVPDDPKYRIGYSLDNLKLTWGKMEEFVARGLCKSIGVSNFSGKKIRDLVSFCKIKPVLNQVELNPYLQQWELKQTCEELGIYLEAYFPLGGEANTKAADSVSLLRHPVIARIAETHGKTTAQVLIRWAIQRGTICIPKSVHENRIRENWSVFDFELSEEEMGQIRAMDRGERVCKRPYMVSAPMTWQDIWDGEYVNLTVC